MVTIWLPRAGDAHKPPKSGRGSNRADAKSGHCQMERKCENQPISPHGHSAAKSILRGCPPPSSITLSSIDLSVHRSIDSSLDPCADSADPLCVSVSLSLSLYLSLLPCWPRYRRPWASTWSARGLHSQVINLIFSLSLSRFLSFSLTL